MKIPEKPRYLLRIKGDAKEFREVVKTLAKSDVNIDSSYKDQQLWDFNVT